MSFSSKILYGLLLLLATGCSSNVPTGGGPAKPDISINTAILRNNLRGEEKIALMSCIRCGCFVNLLNNLTSADKAALKDVVFLSDTTCNKINYPSLHISQAAIDSISFDLYNVVLFRKENQDYKMRIIETDESKDFSRICSDFFR
jgi:hypothetical protein